jgi:hypothetical protein
MILTRIPAIPRTSAIERARGTADIPIKVSTGKRSSEKRLTMLRITEPLKSNAGVSTG